jgi:hypothetical protein
MRKGMTLHPRRWINQVKKDDNDLSLNSEDDNKEYFKQEEDAFGKHKGYGEEPTD